MLPQEKGSILEIRHNVTRDLKIDKRHHKTASVDIKIDIFTDSFYYTDEKHREMINEIEGVIRKYI